MGAVALEALDEDTLARIADRYAADPVLGRRLADALAANAIAAPANEKSPQGGPAKRYVETVRAAAAFLARPDGPQVAVFDTSGWDTHANQGAADGQLAGRLAALDAGLRIFKEQLGPAWRNTAVVVVTEFGRTAAANGTRGTDHGTAGAAFLLGGAVNGGRVVADWPGLAARDLYEGRDLKPTLDLRAVLKGLLEEHLGVPADALENGVFPDSAAARPVRGLIRA